MLAVGAFVYALIDPDANPIGSLPPLAAGEIWAVVAATWVWRMKGIVAGVGSFGVSPGLASDQLATAAAMRRRYSLSYSDLDR